MSHMKEHMHYNHRAISIMYESMEDYDKEAPAQIAKHNQKLYNDFYGSSYLYGGSGHWWGGDIKSCKDAMDLCKRGSPQMLETIQKMWGEDKPDIELASSRVHKRRRKVRRGDHGDTLDIHRVWAGELDRAWSMPQSLNRLDVSKKHATLYLDLAGNAGVAASSALWRAAAMIAMCDILTSAGRSVEIWVGDSTTGGYHGGYYAAQSSTPYVTFTGMCVKQYGEPLNEERMAVMSTMLFYRSYAFFMMMATPYRLDSVGGARNEGMPIQLTERKEAGELVVRLGSCTTKEQALEEFNNVKADLEKEHEYEAA